MTVKKIISSIMLAVLIILLFNTYSDSHSKKSENVHLVSANNTNIDLDGPVIESVSPSKCQEYIIGNPSIEAIFKDDSGVDLSSIKLYVNYIDVTDKCKITEDKISYNTESKFKRGNQIVKLELSDKLKNTTKLEWYFTVGTPVYNHYRGLLHSHTSASDGHGTFNDAYYMARDKANLDFFAITEHSNLLDNNDLCNLDDANNCNEWNELLTSRDKFTKNNEFIGLNGFEMTYDFNVLDPIGHINIFNSKGFVTANNPDITLEKFYSLISKDEDLIGQFNHPCDKFGKFKEFKYSPQGDKVMCLLEVCNGYNKDMNKNIKSFDMYQLALDNGWHVAPTCGQDNHRVDFGVANEFRTVILSTSLNRDNIYDSLRNMRVYATEDKNIRIDYTINDSPMGSELKKPSKIRFSISAVDNDYEDKIKKIEVISNNSEIIKSQEFDSNLAKLEFTLKPKANAFYYVKITQENDKTSVTAPIWIKK